MRGLFFEDFEPGMAFAHDTRRTITEYDNVLFCAITLNTSPIHIDAEYCRTTEFGQPLVESLQTLGIVCGIPVSDMMMSTTVANLGFSEIRFPLPVFAGDTLRVRTEIVGKRDSDGRPDAGIVYFRHLGINQRDETVCEAERAGLMLRRPLTPEPVEALVSSHPGQPA